MRFKILALLAGFLSAHISYAQLVPVFESVKGMTGGSNLATGRDVAIDAAGNVYTVGDFWNTVDFDPGAGTYDLTSAGGYDVFVTKLDADGKLVWARSMGGSNYNMGYAIAVDASGNVYTTGRTVGTGDFDPGAGVSNLTAPGAGYANIFISKLDANGNFVWAQSIGSSTEDNGYDIAVDASGNVYTTGNFSNTVDFNQGAGAFNMTASNLGNTFIYKADGDGNFIWAKAFTSTYDQETYAIAVDASGNVYTTGYWYFSPVDFDPGPGTYDLTNAGGDDFFVSRLDINGDFVWAKSIGGAYGDQSQDIAVDAGNVYVTGKFVGTVDFDPGAGVSNLTAADATGDAFVLKLDIDGNFTWAKAMGGTGITSFSGNENRSFSIAVNATGDVYTTGRFSGTGDFDPGAGTFTLAAGSNSTTDIYVSKLDKDGNFVWAGSMGHGNYEVGFGIVLDTSGYIYVTGQSQGTVDFDPGPCVYNLTGGMFIFVLKLSEGIAIPAPTITSFTPVSGPVGTEVIITGTNFTSVVDPLGVKFYNNKAAVVTTSTGTDITTTVPTGTATGKISVSVNCMTVTSATNFTISAAAVPTITSFTPSSGPIGTTVTITGTNFSTTPGNNTVRFNGTTTTVSASTATSITVTVPSGATTGKITVTVGGNTATSATNFTVTTGPSIAFTTQPVDRTLCAGTNTTLSVVASGDTNLQYRWQINNAGFVDLTNTTVYSGVNTATLTITNATSALNGKIYRCVVRGDNAADTPSASADLTVNNVPATPTIGTTDLGCAPASTTLTPTGAVSGQSYRYYDAATDGTLLGSGPSFTTPSLSVSSTYYISTYHTTTLCESTRTAAVVNVQSCNPPVVIATTSAAYLEGIVTIDLSSLISDPDNNLDVNTLQIISQPVSGAMARLNGLILTVDYSGLPFPGTDALTIGICDLTEICTEQQLTIETDGDIAVYNAVSPNGDGKNDTFTLRYIDVLPDAKNNHVTILNRWGDVIFEIRNYDNKERVFNGLNKGGNEVTSGTYFYKIEFSSGRATKMGYLVVKH